MITGKADPADRSDDIAQLRQHLDMPDLNYQDISLLVGVQQALQRWPLLGESCRASAQGTLYATAPQREVLSP
ncbi:MULTISPECIES: cellulose biosynthesis protein BcsR [unclassified Pseudomonas]|uniref:cellulose biosynthesis protein BcsR n=1 Tax=unclassified Pseudomonas TaxID=196821 RepID=UPI000A1F3C68|nr:MULTISPECIES: cellulose biosynthesis protein BcsR [unclassified Pseudomonas]WGV20835.1 cellulose biosynthesis protein BcsR [Pseudomonas putida]